jgi:lysophospholipase L1-like esterase
VVARHPTVPVTDAWHVRWEVFGDDLTLWAADWFHGSNEGHALYAEATIPLVEKALELSSWTPEPQGNDGSST